MLHGSNAVHAEMRKRVFWSAYSMECAACIHLGRPLSLHYHEIDTEVCLLYVISKQWTAHTNMGSSRPMPMSYMLRLEA